MAKSNRNFLKRDKEPDFDVRIGLQRRYGADGKPAFELSLTHGETGPKGDWVYETLLIHPSDDEMYQLAMGILKAFAPKDA